MRSVRKLVYYCDFCDRYKLTPQSMKVHEKHCTMNPDRVCRMPGCRNKSCPWCELAIARQTKWVDWDFDRDIKEELRAWRTRYFDRENSYV